MANIAIKAAVMVAVDVVSSIVGAPPPAHGPRIQNRAISSSAYGQAIQRCRGTVRLEGNLIWSTHIQEGIYKSVSGLFGSQAVYSYQYSASMAIAFARGPAASFLTVWADGKRLYSTKSTAGSLTGIVNVDATASNPVPEGSIAVPLITGPNSSIQLSAGAIIQFLGDPGRDYEVQADFSLGAEAAGAVQIWPPLQVSLVGPNDGNGPVPYTNASFNITVAGSSKGPTLSEQDFTVDPAIGHLDLGGPRFPGAGITFYLGTSTQLPDHVLEEYDGVGNVPGYRDLVYMVVDNLQLANFGNRLPNFTAEIAFESSTQTFSATKIAGVTVESQSAWNKILIPSAFATVPMTITSPYVLETTWPDPQDPTSKKTRVNVIDSRTNTLINSFTTLSSGTAPVGVQIADADGYYYKVSQQPNIIIEKYNYLTGALVAALPKLPNVGFREADQLWAFDQPNAGTSASLATQGKFLLGGMHNNGNITVIDRQDGMDSGNTFNTGEGGLGAAGIHVANDGDGALYVAQSVKVYRMDTTTAGGGLQTDGIHTLPLLGITDVGVALGVPHWGGPNSLNNPAILPGGAEAMYVWADVLYVLCSGGKAVAIDTASGQILNTATTTFPGGTNGDGISAQPNANGDVFISESAIKFRLHLPDILNNETVTAVEVVNVGNFFDTTPTGESSAADLSTGSIWVANSADNSLYRIFAPTQTGGPVGVAEIIRWLCAQSGLDVSQYDVTAAGADVVEGVQFPQESLHDSIIMLMNPFLIDSAETDGRILFRKRDRVPIVLIPEFDLGALESISKREPRLIEKLAQETDLPETVSFTFYDTGKLYQQAVQYSKRISQPYADNTSLLKNVTYSRTKLSVILPISDTAGNMKQQTEKMLFDIWAGRFSYAWKTLWKYWLLDPTDIIQILYKTFLIEVRITQVDRGATMALQFGGVSHDSGIYTSIAVSTGGTGSGGGLGGGGGTTGGGGGGGTGNPPPPVLVAQLMLMDSPYLEDTEDSAAIPEVHYGLGSANTAFAGAIVLKSIDGNNYTQVASRNVTVYYANAMAALADPDPALLWQFDDSAALTIKPLGASSSTLAGATDDDLINNHANLAALIKQNGEVELLQFGTVTDNGDGTFNLTHLIRGVRGTETMAVNHAVGDIFVLLDGPQDIFSAPITDLNQLRYYKAIPTGQPATSGAPVSLVLKARSLMPYAPYNIGGVIDAQGNISITWARRTRLGAAIWVSGVNGPLSEATEAYEVDVLASDGTVVRTLKGITAPGVVYTAAQQTADFGDTSNDLTVVVYQMSAAVGRGFPGRKRLPFDNGIPPPPPTTTGVPTMIRVTSPNPDAFIWPHKLGRKPLAAFIDPAVSDGGKRGTIRWQDVDPIFDETNLFLDADDVGLTCIIWLF